MSPYELFSTSGKTGCLCAVEADRHLASVTSSSTGSHMNAHLDAVCCVVFYLAWFLFVFV